MMFWTMIFRTVVLISGLVGLYSIVFLMDGYSMARVALSVPVGYAIGDTAALLYYS